MKRFKTSAAGGGQTQLASLVAELRRQISEHKISPGAKLNEQQIANDFGVSRARAREVIGALEVHGLVERHPNRGAVVRRLELHEMYEIYDVREVLEGLAVRRAVENENPETWKKFLDNLTPEFESRIAAGDIELYEVEFNRFRKAVIAAADNPVITGMLDSVQDQTQIIMRRVLVLPGRAERGLVNLKRLLEAMSKGQAEEAEKLRRIGIRAAIDDLKRYERFVL
ncbi:MAG: GntR family transcriptional regulator [Pararhodobacter sp.]|nr:GntR family transcriptional regulator [Pararhodobacter sp.]